MTTITETGSGDIDLSGGAGNDILEAEKTGFGQFHMYGASGDDLLLMHLTNKEGWGPATFHSYGAFGNDTFSFVNVKGAEIDSVARLDDFNPTRDKLVVEGQVIDLYDVPAGMRVVSYLGQQWLHINNDTSQGNADPLKGDIMIALDGHRQMPDRGEVHFSPFPADVDALPTVAFVDDNYVPHDLYAAREASLKKLTSGADNVTGTEGADYIYHYKDPSLPVGLASTISALGGDDVIEAGSGYDTVNGGAGNDLISGGLDNDIVLGGTGNDRLLGGSEDDRLDGQAGNDTLDGGRGFDEAVFGGAKGSYTITTSGGVTTVVDNRSGTPDGTDTITGVERLIFSDQVVDLGGSAAGKILVGSSDDNTLTGGDGSDEIYGRGGNDTLSGLGGNDKILGEGMNDRLDGGLGDDTLDGGTGSDILTGGDGNDRLDGGAAKDTLKGGAGTDTLLGGTQADVLEGGAGADDFVFTAVNHSLTGLKDTLLDFVRGEDDIVVSAIDANTALAGDQAFVLDAGGTFTGGEIRQRVANGNLLLEFNTDADSTVEMTLLLKGVTAPLAATDFDL